MPYLVKRYLKVYSPPIFMLIFFAFSMWKLNGFIYAIPILGCVALYKIIKRHRIVRLNFTDIAIIGILIQQTISWLGSSYQPNSLIYFTSALLMSAFYFTLRFYGVRGTKRRNLFLHALMGWGGILALITILSFLFFRFNIKYEGFNDVINFRNLYHPLGMLSNDWVSFLLLFLTFSTGSLLISSNKYLKISSGITSILLVLCLIVSFSRGAYLSILLFFGALIILLSTQKSRKALLSVGLVLFIIAFASLSFQKGIFTTMAMTSNTSQIRSISGRIVLWEGAVDMFLENSISGVGPGNFVMKSNQYLHKQPDSFYSGRISNSFLQLLAEQGIIGVIIWGVLITILIIFLIRCAYADLRKRKDRMLCAVFLSGILALGLREMTFSSFFENPGLQLGLAIVAALVSNICVPEKVLINRNTSSLLILLFICLSTVHVHNVQKAQQSTKYNARFLELFEATNNDEALMAINNAIEQQPENALLYFNRALLSDTILTNYNFPQYPLPGNEYTTLSMPIKDLQKAIELSPTDAMFHHNLAILYWAIGDIQNSEKEFIKALELEPYETLFNCSYGAFLIRIGEGKAGLKYLEESITLSPQILDGSIIKKMVNDSILPLIIKTPINSKIKNPITQGRNAKILLYLGDTITAKKKLHEVTNHLPNLNRPWFYLARIALSNGDTIGFKTAIQRSLLLDKTDFLPTLTMANWHTRNKNYRDAIYYYRRSLINYKNLVSPHYRKTLKYYYTRTMPNDVLPLKLLGMTTTTLNIPATCRKLAFLYEQINEPDKANDYKRCAVNEKLLWKTLQKTDIK